MRPAPRCPGRSSISRRADSASLWTAPRPQRQPPRENRAEDQCQIRNHRRGQKQEGVEINARLTRCTGTTWLFPGSSSVTALHERDPEPARAAASDRWTPQQIVTLTCIAGLMLSVVTGFWLGLEPDIGVIALGFGAALALLYPEVGAEGVRRIDWSTILTVGGIVTFVAVLQRMDAVNLLGHAVMKIGTPLVAAS
jgi:hypothetical protein